MPSFTRAWWRLAPIALVIIVGCGPFKLSNRFSAVETVLKSYKVDGKQQIVADTFNGAVDVLTGASDKVEIKVTKRTGGPSQAEADDDLDNVEVRFEQTGDKVEIHVRSINPKPFVNRGAAIEIQVPEGSTLDLRTTNGKIGAVGLVGNTSAHTSNGAIEIKGTQGALDLETSNGNISTEGGIGKISAKSSNGGIDIASDNGIIDAHTSNGRITYRGKLVAGDHVLDTSNGTVSVKLPGDAAFKLEARTSNGRITNDFTGQSEPSGKKKKASKSQLSGTFGGRQSSATLNVHTSNGNIEIRNQ
jgi:Putative adhesin